MAKRRVKKTAKQAPSSPIKDDNAKDTQIENEDVSSLDKEVERQSAAIWAIRDVEIERLLTGISLLQSYFDQDQLKTPSRQFFEENLPNLSFIRKEENGQFEVFWNHKDGKLYEDASGRDIHTSILRGMSTAYPDCSVIPSIGGFELSTETVKTRLFGADNLQIRDFFLDEPSDGQMLGLQEAFRTPGTTSQRLSIGMTPKTLRVPKPGEMLLSVRGSPLGVYKEDNMEAIHESEEG